MGSETEKEKKDFLKLSAGFAYMDFFFNGESIGFELSFSIQFFFFSRIQELDFFWVLKIEESPFFHTL